MYAADVIQALLDASHGQRYLEIGSPSTRRLARLRAAERIGIGAGLEKQAARTPGSGGLELHAMDAEAWFGTAAERNKAFDVVFLTGFHDFNRALRSFCNAIALLKPGGAVVIDNIRPPDYAATLPAPPPGLKPARWTGDVYRLLFFIDTFFQGWSPATVAETGRHLVVWRETRREVPERRAEAIARLPFECTTGPGAYKTRPLREIVAAVGASQ